MLKRHDNVNNMHGWFQNLLKSRTSLASRHEEKSRTSLASRHEENASETSVSTSFSYTSSSSSEPKNPPSALSSHLRWRRKYDLLVCHSQADSDIEEANGLVSLLEASPRSLRCFLWQRDVSPGSPIFTEFCQAVQESHLQVLLITPDFLQEEWCMYMMHQALAEGPMSRRLIPLIQNLSHDQYPQEIKFCFYINLSRNISQGCSLINMTLLKYLEDLIKNERTHDSNVDSSHNRLSGESSSQGDELISNNDPAET
ncbi:toll/interleukin-1 receptor domain-containing adapter protein [Paralichthys olivaceus]|uniref:toll/interleukin-1 receptor domain-containing adapter protein n=1 Tax=Paralichthys olivaceus TaxID=8255 RepID=UPI00097D3B84|nr:PREDICTED: toll/interleukin-1 receptor domain-containing adapter protein isoform X2 [Paralichthys olivaceus]